MTFSWWNSKTKRNKVILLTGASIAAIVLLFMANLLLNPVYAPSEETLSFVNKAIAEQEKIETELRAYYHAGKFTFDHPLVIQNPYRTSPLTALVIFDTPENSQISIHVPGDTPEAAVDFTFPEYQQHHEIPIYGLYADRLNRITLSMKTLGGEMTHSEIDLQTEPLAVYVQRFSIDVLNRSEYSPGFNFPLLDRKQVFDIDGNIRWYSTQESFRVLTRLANGRFMFTYSIGGDREGNVAMEKDLLGKIYAIYVIEDGIHHELYELPNGKFLITSADLKSGTIEDYLIEVDPSSGHILRSFDLKVFLDPGRPNEIGNPAEDWLHLNSIDYDSADRSIIISSKNQSAVIKMSYPEMKIEWILGPHDNWSEKFQPYLLAPKGENFEWSWSQHHATIVGEESAGDPAIDILLFDNGQYRSFDPTTAALPSDWYSRLVRYKVNEADMTVNQVWEYGKANGATLFSGTRGSVYLLPNGDILGTWGDIAKDAQGDPSPKSVEGGTVETRIIEVSPSNEIVFEARGTDLQTYRCLRGGLYDWYSEKNTFLLTQVNNTAGNDLLDRIEMAQRAIHRWDYSLLSSLKKFGRQILHR